MIDFEEIGKTLGPDVKVFYENFHPTHEQRWEIDNCLIRLSERCPGRSLLLATFTYNESLYVLEVLVQSFQDSFSSKTKALHLGDCLVSVEEEIFSQLRPWRQRRFKKERFLPSSGQM